MSTELQLAIIRRDGGTQPRAYIDDQTVENYAESLTEGEALPPIVVFYDGTDYWLADGYHRYYAAEKLTWKTYPCEIHQGTRRDAVLYSVGANSVHGLPRSNGDKRRSVETLVKDEEWGKWSNCEIARRCAVAESFVRKVKGEGGNDTSHCAKYVHPKTGNTTKMNTANIGKSKQGIASPKPAPVTPPTPPSPVTEEYTEPATTPPTLIELLARAWQLILDKAEPSEEFKRQVEAALA